MSVYEIRDMAIEIDGKRLVEDVNITVEAGKCTAIIGASGSGKSLTCLTPFGLTPGTASGSIKLDGIELTSANAREMHLARSRNTGFVFQQPLTALTPHLTIGKQLQEAASQAGPQRLSRHELAQMLARVGLSRADERLDQFPHRLSGGERQRVMIAAAVAHQPKLLIADEPTSALDASLRAEIMELLDELRVEHGLATLLVSHDIASVESHSDDLIVMDKGKVVESGPTVDIITNPQRDYTKRLIAATPSLAEPAPHLPVVGEILLQAEGATVLFPRPGWRRGKIEAVADASLSVRESEAVAIVGGSGSGKSTLGRAVVGIGPLTFGTIKWQQGLLPERRERSLAMRKLIQPVFQDPVASLNPRWKVGDIVLEPLRNLSPELSGPERNDKLAQALNDVGLGPEYIDRVSTSLSGGQAQRVAIARAIIAGPKMLVLDEATSALDPLVGGAILQLLSELQRAHGLSIIFITHDIASARRLCHRIVVLDAGHVVEMGDMAEVVESPKARVTKLLIEAS